MFAAIRLVLTALLGLAAIAPSHAVVVSVNPAVSSATVGDSILVNIDIADLFDGVAPSVSAFDISVAFDPGIVSFSQLAFGTGLDVLGLGSSQIVTPSAGSVNAFELSFDLPADLNTLQPGAFTLFTLTFDAIAAGSSNLSLTLNALADADGAGLAATLVNGSVNVSPVPLPAAGWLLLTGIAGLAGMARRRSAMQSRA